MTYAILYADGEPRAVYRFERPHQAASVAGWLRSQGRGDLLPANGRNAAALARERRLPVLCC